MAVIHACAGLPWSPGIWQCWSSRNNFPAVQNHSSCWHSLSLAEWGLLGQIALTRPASLVIKDRQKMGCGCPLQGLTSSNQAWHLRELPRAASVDPPSHILRVYDAWTVGECINQLGLPWQNTADWVASTNFCLHTAASSQGPHLAFSVCVYLCFLWSLPPLIRTPALLDWAPTLMSSFIFTSSKAVYPNLGTLGVGFPRYDFW